VAAEPIDFDLVARHLATLSRDSDLTIVEGAGGLLVPLGGGRTIADLIDRLGLPVLVVARAALGTINHTLLTVEALRRRQLPLLGVVFSRQHRRRDPSMSSSVEAIARYGDARVFGTLPWIAHVDRASPAQLAKAGEQLRLDNLLRLL
jgi:dethiobiotin synthetase